MQLDPKKQRFFLAEIYRNNINKIFSSQDMGMTIQKLGIRVCDSLVAYETLMNSNDLEEERKAYYADPPSTTLPVLKKGLFVDILDSHSRWNQARIEDLPFESKNTKEFSVKVSYKSGKTETIYTTNKKHPTWICAFRSRSIPENLGVIMI